MHLSLALALSFLPAFLCAAFIYWIDRYEKEPKLLLGGVFWWGAVVAAGGALISQMFLTGTVELATGSAETAQLAGATLFAPLTEESLKGMAVLVVFLVFRREFDSVLDGLVYAGVAALGFAATENTLYYIDAATKHGVEGMLGLWFVRGVLGAWDHPFYTAWIGLGLAATRLSLSTAVRWLAPPAGWGLAVGTHSLHNILASAAPQVHELGVVMFLLDWAGWFVIAVVLLGAVWRERRLLQLQLADEVARGTLDERQYRTALSAGFHLGARMRALFSGRLLATRRFYRLCGELAHKKQQIARLGDEDGASLLVEKLREEMRQLAPLAAA